MFKYSIIIPSHNRPNLLLRSLKYYTNFDLNIIIICEKNNVNNEINSLINNNLYKINLIEVNNHTFIEKILIARKCIKTKYCLISPDDDFYDIDSINNGIVFLDNNIDYASYVGNFVQFKKNKYHTNIYKMYNYNEKFNFSKSDFFSKKFKFILSIYALHRTDVFLKILDFEEKIKYLKQATLEFDFYFLSLFYGKTKVVRDIWMYRDQERYTEYNKRYDTEKNSNNINLLFVINKSFLNSQIYKNYLNEVCDFISKIEKIKSNNYFLKELINSYFNLQYIKNTRTKINLKSKFSKKSPKFILELYYYFKFKFFLIRYDRFYKYIYEKPNYQIILKLL